MENYVKQEPHDVGFKTRLISHRLADNVMLFTDDKTDEQVMVVLDHDFNATMWVLRYGTKNSITFAESTQFWKGKGIARRAVFHYVTREHATALRVGMTFHDSAFSSTPHEFEKTPEVGFEEIFWFLLPDGGKAILEGEGKWPSGEDVDETWPVRHGQTMDVPMGWHRVVALPDEEGNVPRVGYVWAYLCLHDRWEK